MKIKRKLKEEQRKFHDFGFEITFWDVSSKIIKKPFFYEKKHKAILKYLKNKYSVVISNYQKISSTPENITVDCPIWVFWYQGFDNAPELVKNCLRSLKTHAGKHPVIELSKNNYSDYVDIPQYIIDKFTRGEITITHFSDILRISLLAQYGGCWSDATLYYNNWLYDDITEYKWYSIKQQKEYNSSIYVSKYQWSTFFLICGVNNVIAKYMREIFYLYIKEHSSMIDYFLMDYFLALGYEEIPAVKSMIDQTPYNNPDITWLSKHVTDEYNEDEYFKVANNTSLFKLSWKSKYDTQENSYLNKLLNENAN